MEYLFNERQQIFTLPAAGRAAEESSARLKASFRENAPVKVLLNPRQGLIQKIDVPSAQEMDEFNRLRVPLEKPDKTLPIVVASIDPTTFNIVDYYLKSPTFRLCTRVVPDYKTAKKLFDFCAKQSCHWSGSAGRRTEGRRNPG